MAMMDVWRPRRGLSTRGSSGANPFNELARLQRDVEDMFERFFGDGETGGRAAAFAPAVDVVDRGNEILVRADLPGLDRSDVEILVEDGMLTVRGERQDTREENKNNVRVVERWGGAFVRTIALPAEAERDKIQAELNNGVLEIHVPKKREAAPKKIDVK